MSQHPQTIQIYLPKGNPRGLRIAEITTRTVRMIEIPRLLLDDFLAMSEAERVGVYFLIGSNDEDSLPHLYIGQTGDLATRLKDHHNKKDFWERAFVMVSRTNSMTQTHALFLEWLSIKAATEAARYILDNGNAGSRPHTTPPLEAECRELHETTALLLATLGHSVFESLTTNTRAEGVTHPTEQSEFFYLHYPQHGVEAKALYTTDGCVVLQGSTIRLETGPSLKGTGAERMRQNLLKDGTIVKDENGVCRFTRDYLFKTPSRAARIVLGRSSNGWQEWRNEAGKTLDDLKRQGA